MRRLLLVVLTVAVTVGLAGAPASAQTKVRKDKVGDAPARADIRSVKVQNTASRFAYTVRLTRVTRTRSLVTMGISTPPTSNDQTAPSSVIAVTTAPTPTGGQRSTLSRIDITPTADDVDLTFTDVACPGLRTRTKGGRRGFIRVVVPQSCLGPVAGRTVANVVTADIEGFDADVRSTLVGARRGDEPEDIPVDFLSSSITTRRG